MNFSISKHVFVALLIPPSVWDANEILMTEKQFPSFIHKFVSILQFVTVINADTEKNVPVIYCILIIKIMNWTGEHISLIQNDFHYPFWFSFYSANNYNYWYLKKNDKLTKIGYFSILKVILIFFPDTNYFKREKWFTLTNIYSIDTLKWSLNWFRLLVICHFLVKTMNI